MARVPLFRLRNGLEIRRILNGMWQVSGSHGAIDPKRAAREMFRYYDAGLTTFDMANIYGPAEDIFGDFMRQFKVEREDSPSAVQALTKWVPNPGPMTKEIVRGHVRLAMKRMDVQKLDMLQFHWWDYSDERYLEALGHLADLQKEGLIEELSVTNFNTEHLQKVVNDGIKISTNQLQYSLIDCRPAVKMTQFCEASGISLLAYGVVGGGLLTDRYLHLKEPVGKADLTTASLAKYKQMIDAWGGWELFQCLLEEMSSIAQVHNVSIANVALRYILDKPVVAGVIVGCRFSAPGAQHIEDNFRSLDLKLSADEIRRLEEIHSQGNNLFETTGDCGDEYR